MTPDYKLQEKNAKTLEAYRMWELSQIDLHLDVRNRIKDYYLKANKVKDMENLR